MNTKKFLAIALLGAAVYAFSGCRRQSNEADILEFWVNGVQYDKSGTNFTRIFPKLSENDWGAFPTMSVAPSRVVISPRASIDPPITAPQNFARESGVSYTVTAEDGSRQTFTRESAAKYAY